MFKPGVPFRLTQTSQTCSGSWPPFSDSVSLLSATKGCGVTVYMVSVLESGSPGQGGIRDPVSKPARGQNRSVLGNVLGGISTISLGPVYLAVSGNPEGSHTLFSMDSAEWGIKQATTRGFWGVSGRNLGQANFRETRNCLPQNKLFLGLGVQAVCSVTRAPPPSESFLGWLFSTIFFSSW